MAGSRSDLSVEVFLILRSVFFTPEGGPQSYALRDKRNTQDDPFDEYVAKLLREGLPEGVSCEVAPGPLITPDMVVLRSDLCLASTRAQLLHSVTLIVGLEVKKLERTAGGAVARASGMDYNTTPPCGTMRIYDVQKRPLDIRGFYLFVCQEPEDRDRHYRLSALALCDGNILNDDFEYYLSVVGERRKEVGLGSYGNGADRARPMVIFANPLGAAALDRRVTLMHLSGALEQESNRLRRVGGIRRMRPGGGESLFHCYRLVDDVPAGHTDFDLVDPFPAPERLERTQPRGRFRIAIEPID